ncbi:hypothetical protein T4A_13770 [Trichinella pseudospiralis]|uniref:Uncharacterized protein n=1 Tax=Trichinella pseudospiralis TaxID=6337 RepID=A0A0V1EKA5_TRIPS|nr:hypothetical protein T4A_13770 [Trichinella pseudospiralis]
MEAGLGELICVHRTEVFSSSILTSEINLFQLQANQRVHKTSSKSNVYTTIDAHSADREDEEQNLILLFVLLKRNKKLCENAYRMPPGDLFLPIGWIARRNIGQANLRQRQSNTKMTNIENSDSMARAIISDTSPIPSNHCNGFRYLPILCSVIWLQFSHSPCLTAQLAIANRGLNDIVCCTAHARFGVHLQANPTSSVHRRGQCETNRMQIVTLISCSQAERQFGNLAAFVLVDCSQEHTTGVVQGQIQVTIVG